MLERLADLVALSALPLVPLVASAQRVTTLDASVSSVVSGGYWETDKQRGIYRIVVRGGERVHSPSTLRVEWIADAPPEHKPQVLTSLGVAPIPDGAFSLRQPRLTCLPGVCTLTIYGTEPFTDKPAGRSWVIALRGPGQISVVKSLASLGADWCLPQGATVDSALAVKQALNVMADTSLPLEPHSFQRVEDHVGNLSFLQGFLVSVIPTRPSLGGGGIVWVDAGSGCPIVLHHYE